MADSKTGPQSATVTGGATSTGETVLGAPSSTPAATAPSGFGLKVGEPAGSDIFIIGDGTPDLETGKPGKFTIAKAQKPGEGGYQILTEGQTVTQDHLERLARGF